MHETEKSGAGAHKATTSRSYPRQKLYSQGRKHSCAMAEPKTFSQLSDFHEKQANYESWLKVRAGKGSTGFHAIEETDALLRFNVLKGPVLGAHETQIRRRRIARLTEAARKGLRKR